MQDQRRKKAKERSRFNLSLFHECLENLKWEMVAWAAWGQQNYGSAAGSPAHQEEPWTVSWHDPWLDCEVLKQAKFKRKWNLSEALQGR